MDLLETRICGIAVEIVSMCLRDMAPAIQIIQSVVFTYKRKDKFNQ